MEDTVGKELECEWSASELVLHEPPMQLLDEIAHATETSLEAVVTIDASSPLYAGGDELPAWWSVEYMAQAVATLAGLHARRAGQDLPVGILAGCKRFKANRSGIPLGTTVRVIVNELVSLDGSLAAYTCRMESDVFNAESRITAFGLQPSELAEKI
jgi:predicted hotdog family 3-hydroxylacyl-ACP dehydratase